MLQGKLRLGERQRLCPLRVSEQNQQLRIGCLLLGLEYRADDDRSVIAVPHSFQPADQHITGGQLKGELSVTDGHPTEVFNNEVAAILVWASGQYGRQSLGFGFAFDADGARSRTR